MVKKFSNELFSCIFRASYPGEEGSSDNPKDYI
jgi:hypothetical protein